MFQTEGLMIEMRSSAVVGIETGIRVAVGPQLVLGLKAVVLAVRICSGRGWSEGNVEKPRPQQMGSASVPHHLQPRQCGWLVRLQPSIVQMYTGLPGLQEGQALDRHWRSCATASCPHQHEHPHQWQVGKATMSTRPSNSQWRELTFSLHSSSKNNHISFQANPKQRRKSKEFWEMQFWFYCHGTKLPYYFDFRLQYLVTSRGC